MDAPYLLMVNHQKNQRALRNISHFISIGWLQADALVLSKDTGFMENCYKLFKM